MREYLKLLVKRAFAGTPGIADLWSSVVGALLAVFVHFFPKSESAVTALGWQLPLWAFAVAVASRLLIAPYRIWKEQREELSKAAKRIETLTQEIQDISTNRSFAYINCAIVVTPASFAFWDLNRIEFHFQNLSDYLLFYKPTEVWLEIGGVRTEVNVAQETGTHVHARQSMSYGFDIQGITIWELPFILKFGVAVEYDNVPPLKKRQSRRIVEYTFRSFEPMISSNRIIESEET